MYTEHVTNSTYLPGSGQGYHRDCDTHVSREGLASQRAGCLPQRGCKHFPESRQKFPGWQSNCGSRKCVKTTDDSVRQAGKLDGAAPLGTTSDRLSVYTIHSPLSGRWKPPDNPLSPYPFLSTLPLRFSPPPGYFPSPYKVEEKPKNLTS